ncbi:membrane protein of unknown function [Candidatus Promineifilum breve]|uniref:Uncharacterized protein n=1 Tax=Candidatus Promineifilum breve TaxID=1806508 RepID=A0A160T0P0_9CHLR|nr:glycosyltransferase family 39 protein [Candidatus Promineifilum breve]CUS02298.2 membrane protein of unknown function [Candidatus Promineifilum breve]
MMLTKQIDQTYRGWRPSPGRWLVAATLVLLLASAMRLIALQTVPPGLAQDEVLDADIAQFIRGGEHALFFSHGYGHEPLYHYLAAPFAPLLGDNLLAMRLPSVYLGLALVALTMRWARRDFGATAALVAGLGLAAGWWPVIFSRIGIRPILEPVLLVLAMWHWPLRATRITRRGMGSAALAGLWLGLSIYAYTAARVVLLIPLLLLIIFAMQALWLRRGDRQSEQQAARVRIAYAAIVLSVGIFVALPLFFTLRANPDLQQRLEQLEGPLTALQAGDAGPVLRMTAATLGVFSFTGDPRWTYGLPNRPLFDPLTALLFYGGLLVALWRWRQPHYLLLPIWLAVALLPSALSPDAPSTVRLIGALPVVYLLPGIAVQAVAGRLEKRTEKKSARSLPGALAALILLPALLTAYRTVQNGFSHWPADLETRTRYQSVLLDMGRHWLAAGDARPPVVADVFFEPIDAAGLRRSLGVDPVARWVQSGAGVAGAVVWPRGEPSALYVPEFAPLDAGLMTLAGADPTLLYRSDGSPSFAVYQITPPLLGGINDGLAFASTGCSPSLAYYGVTELLIGEENMEFATWWRAVDWLPDDLAVFVHLLDATGKIVAQHDGLDAAATTLQMGDVILQRHVLPLPATLLPGNYTLQVGMYRRTDGLRLALPDGRDVLTLAHCEVGPIGSAALGCRLTDR